jgi:hypothetical protein
MKRPIARTVLPALLLAVLAAGAASALTITDKANVTTTALAVAYAPDATAKGTAKIRVRKDTYVGNFCVVLTLVSLTPSAAEPLSYRAATPAATAATTLALNGNPAAASEVLSGNFSAAAAASATVNFNYAFQVLSATMPPPGSYVAVIREDLYPSAYPPTGTITDTNTLTVTVTVPPIYDVAAVPTNGAFAVGSVSQNLDFGPLSPGLVRAADLAVRANSPYTLSLASANSGALANPLDPSSRVDYGLTVGGAGVDLSAGPVALAVGRQPGYSAVHRYPLEFAIKPFALFPSAGSYSDTLTVTLTSP